MSPEIRKVFAEILEKLNISGAVLEIGTLNESESLLSLPVLKKASSRVGINIIKIENNDSFKFVEMSAHDMHSFPDGSFQLVLCNSVFEHDRFFWKSLAEIKRVLASGGWLVVGVPGYQGMGIEKLIWTNRWLGKICMVLRRKKFKDMIKASTITLGEHFYPGDYYRFTRQAMEEVILNEYSDVEIRELMIPLRLVGIGRAS